VDGLGSGSDVSLEDVTIGNVKAVRVSKQSDPNRTVEVELRLNRKYQNLIRTDSQLGIIQTQGQRGVRVDITRGTSAGQIVSDGGTVQDR
jgi:ABC-type transporter Mla subunit MlaD